MERKTQGKVVQLADIINYMKHITVASTNQATVFAQFLNTTVLAMDNSLFFDKLPPNEQPGMFVRRIKGRTERATDEEMIAHYSEIIRKLSDESGTTTGRWEFALCVASPEGKVYETTIASPRLFTSTISETRIPGYPNESMQLDPETMKYISEMTTEEQSIFWQKHIGAPLKEFIEGIGV